MSAWKRFAFGRRTKTSLNAWLVIASCKLIGERMRFAMRKACAQNSAWRLNLSRTIWRWLETPLTDILALKDWDQRQQRHSLAVSALSRTSLPKYSTASAN